jgi:hypothetical protein
MLSDCSTASKRRSHGDSRNDYGSDPIRCGVTLGGVSLIGAGTLVIKDVQPAAIVRNTPAEAIEFRKMQIDVK